MGHWAGFRIKTQIYVFICFFGILLLLFIIKFVFLLFQFLFLMKYQISVTEYKNQSETRISSPKLPVELHTSALFQLKYYTTLTTQV